MPAYFFLAKHTGVEFNQGGHLPGSVVTSYQLHTHRVMTSMHVLYGKHIQTRLELWTRLSWHFLSSYTCMEENKLLMFVNSVYTGNRPEKVQGTCQSKMDFQNIPIITLKMK